MERNRPTSQNSRVQNRERGRESHPLITMDREGGSPWPRYGQNHKNNGSLSTSKYGHSAAFHRGQTNHYYNNYSFYVYTFYITTVNHQPSVRARPQRPNKSLF